MPTYTVSVNRSYTVNVDVVAESAEAAAETVSKRNFPLPPLEQWQGNKDWIFTVYDDNGDIVANVE